MTDSRADIPSVVERTRPIKAGAPVVAAHVLGETAVLVLGEEALILVPRGGEPRTVAVHGGAILCSSADADRIVTGGDDGKVVSIGAQGESSVIATDAKHRWIDHVAVGPSGTVAWSVGRQAFVRTAKGTEQMLEVRSTVGGLAFAPKGLRLAVAHYNGVTLWFPNAQSEPDTLEWKGSHLGVAFSPDARFVVTSMQEPTLHGWRLADRKDMRMSGYGARVRSLDWTAGGKWLARWWRSVMPTGSFCWCASRTAPRSWRARERARPSRRWHGARAARCSPSAPTTATLASSISADARLCYCFFCAPPFPAGWAPASALSGSRFQTWVRPNSEMPR
jgi:WD40 repeat protein